MHVDTVTVITPGVGYMVAPTFTIGGVGPFNATIDQFGHVLNINSVLGDIAPTSTIIFTDAQTDMEYSAWRYSPVNSAWDRVNSWSLYNVYPPEPNPVFNPVAFNMIATTPSQDGVFISNNSNNQLFPLYR